MLEIWNTFQNKSFTEYLQKIIENISNLNNYLGCYELLYPLNAKKFLFFHFALNRLKHLSEWFINILIKTSVPYSSKG